MGHYDSCREGYCPKCGQVLGYCEHAKPAQVQPLTKMMERGADSTASANERQVGGSHYNGALQHWDLIENHGIGYLEGCATKYVQRHRKKNGLQDLEKAEHYVQKLVELHAGNNRVPRGVVPMRVLGSFCRGHGLNGLETAIIIQLCTWTSAAHLQAALRDVQTLIMQEKAV